MSKLVAVFSLLLTVLVGVPASAAEGSGRGHRFPSVIDLPAGFSPEGIAVGRGTTFYVGSLADGSIYRGDLRTGEGAVLTEPAGSFTTVGINVDHRERVWVAGGPTGTGRVYDGRSGELLATYELTGPFQSFINDVIVTRDAAWFTDSGTENDPDPAMGRFAGSPRLFKVPLGPRGRLPNPDAVEELPLDVPDVDFPNLNGIETAPGRRGLIVAHSALESLFIIDPATGAGQEIDIETSLAAPDGLVRRGRTLYVVEPTATQVTAIRLNRTSTSGTVVTVLPLVGGETPTTAAIFRSGLYVVDARFLSMTDPPQVFRLPLR